MDESGIAAGAPGAAVRRVDGEGPGPAVVVEGGACGVERVGAAHRRASLLADAMCLRGDGDRRRSRVEGGVFSDAICHRAGSGAGCTLLDREPVRVGRSGPCAGRVGGGYRYRAFAPSALKRRVRG